MFLQLALAIAVAAAARDTPCFSASAQRPSDNLCLAAADGGEAPNCVNVGSFSVPDYKCRACAANCDCAAGEYCTKTPGPDAGKCAKLSDTGKIGKSCTNFGLPGTPGARVPVLGADDASICGGAIFSPATSEFVNYEWLGSCVDGKCRMCAGEMAAWAIALAAAIVPGLAQSNFANFANFTKDDGGSLVCGGTYCDGGQIRRTDDSWMAKYYSTGVLTATFAFVMLIFFTLLVTSLAECCARRREQKG